MDYSLSLAGPSMADPRLKLGWAKHHLKLLESEVNRFNESKPYTFKPQDNLETSEYAIHFFLKGIPAAVGLIFGDFISCLRSSLDHLAYQLTLLPGGTADQNVYFPVIGVNNSNGRRLFNRDTSPMVPAAIPIIKSLQPYHRGESYKATKLWQLHILWNIDKHRRIPYHFGGVEVKIGHPPDVQPIYSGTNYGGIARFPLSSKPNVDLKPSVQLSIVFGDETEGVLVDITELRGIHDFVRDEVLAKFDYLFPDVKISC